MISDRIAHLDRRVTNPSVAYSSGTDTTTWTVPYEVPVDGLQGVLSVCLTDTAVQLSGTTRPSLTTIAVTGQGDLSSRPVVVGVLYEWRYTPTLPYLRGRDGKPALTSDLLIRRCALHFAEASDVTIEIARRARAGNAVRQTLLRAGAGKVAFPLSVRREDIVWLTFTSNSPSAAVITGLTWIGDPILRARPV